MERGSKLQFGGTPNSRTISKRRPQSVWYVEPFESRQKLQKITTFFLEKDIELKPHDFISSKYIKKTLIEQAIIDQTMKRTVN